MKKNLLTSLAFILAMVCCLPVTSFCQAEQDSLAVSNTLNNFIHDFSYLNWQKFTGYFASNATAFFPPSANSPYRANNKTEIEAIFTKVFDHARVQKTSPPYLTIEPQNVNIAMAGNVAIVTFTLNDPGMVSRRTLVFEKEQGVWLIIHLHASGIAVVQ